MKLIIAIVNKDDSESVVKELNKKGFYVTRLSTNGGFLRKGNNTLMIGTDKVEEALQIIKNECSERQEVLASAEPYQNVDTILPSEPIWVSVGGATCFVVEVDQFLKF